MSTSYDLQSLRSSFKEVDISQKWIPSISEKEWRTNRDPLPEAYLYLECAKHEWVDTRYESLQQAGVSSVVKSGGFRKASHELQEINMRGRQDILANIRRRKHMFPAVGDRLDEFFRILARPNVANLRGLKFDREVSPTTRARLMLYLQVCGWMCKRRILVTGMSSIPGGERIEATPTAPAPPKGAM